jgi:hypothetical protein
MDADRHVIVRVLDDLVDGIDAEGFGDGLHEGIVPLMEVDYFENTHFTTV